MPKDVPTSKHLDVSVCTHLCVDTQSTGAPEIERIVRREIAQVQRHVEHHSHGLLHEGETS